MSFFRNFFRNDAKDWTGEAVKHLKKTLKLGKFTGVLPYNWDDRKQELELSQSRKRFAFFVSQFLVYLMYEGFVICRLISFTLDENSTTKDKGALQYLAVAYSLPIVWQFSSFSNVYDLHFYINRLLHYMRNDFQELPNDGRKVTMGKLMRILPYTALAVIILNMSTLFRRPESPQLLTSLLSDEARRYKWVLTPFALFHFYIWCNQWGVFLFYSAVILSYLSAAQSTLNRTRPNRHLSAEGFYRATKQLELLQGNVTALFRSVFYAAECVFVPMTVYALCGSIRSEGAQAAKHFIVAAVCMALLFKFWSGLGSVFEISRQVLTEWQKREEMPSLMFRKQFKSMRPIRVQVGHYYVDAAATLTVLTIISQNTLNVLLAA